MILEPNGSVNNFLKFDFPNKNVLKTEVSFCARSFRSIERISFIKFLSLKCIICAIEKEVNGGLITVTTTMQSVKSYKFRANLNYFKWLKPTRRRVRSLIPSGLRYLKVQSCLGPIKFNIWFFEDCKVAES